MLAPWLVYTSCIGLVLVAIALLGERVLRWRSEPTRWIWLAIIVTMPLPPLLLNLFPAPGAISPASVVYSAVSDSPPLAPPIAPVAPRHNYDTPLLALWLLASSLVLLRVLGAAVALRRRRRSWITAELGGHSVLLTDELGPAVIGWRRFTTVIPRWALSFDESSRALMLAHEAEHANSGDPYLRSAALFALVLMPWNPALWFAARRLRLAIEMDCDQRVLARGADRQQYASLLLAVGERMSVTPFAWATALGGTRSLLETRVRGMVAPWVPRHPRIAIGALSVAAIAIAIVACSAPVPEPVRVAARQSGDSLTSSCKTGTGCPDSDVMKLVNWAVTVRNPSATHFHLPGTGQRGCLQSASVCGSIVDTNGTETLFSSDTLFVDSKSGRIWTSQPDDDIEIQYDPATHREYRAGGAHYCWGGVTYDCAASPPFFVKTVSMLKQPINEGSAAGVPKCTPEQVTKKQRMRSGEDRSTFWPRCVE